MAAERGNLLKLAAILLICSVLYLVIPAEILPSAPKLALCLIVLTIVIWSLQIMPLGYTSLFILMLFSLLELAPAENIFGFMLSPVAYLVISSFILAKAVEKSGLGKRLAVYLFSPFVRSYATFVIAIYLTGIVLSLFIPHPFSRSFIMLAMVKAVLAELPVSKEEKISLGLAVFVAGAVNSTIFLTGDMSLNVLAANFAGIDITWLEWLILMGVPSLALHVLVIAVHLMIFPDKHKKRLQLTAAVKQNGAKLSPTELRTVLWLLAAIILWCTDYWHGIHPGWVAVMSVTGLSLPYIGNVVKIEDFRTVNIDLIIFIAAAVAIGQVGFSTGLNEFLAGLLFPGAWSANPWLIGLFICLAGMVLHIIVGSAITLLSVLVPLAAIYFDTLSFDPLVSALIVYLCAKVQWIFPFNQMDLLIGLGEENGYYSQKHVILFGAAMIIPLILALLLFYIPWWILIGKF
jgi:di/tricarboxylate transporter